MAIFVNRRLHRSIYSTNLIKSVNKQLKKYTKSKETFPNEASLERFLARCHLGFDQARAELEAMLNCYMWQSTKFRLSHLHKIIEGP